MCYCKAYLKNTGTMTCGTTMKLQYEISCSNCGLGPAKTGAVLMTYNEHSMQGVIDDSDLKQLIKDLLSLSWPFAMLSYSAVSLLDRLCLRWAL